MAPDFVIEQDSGALRLGTGDRLLPWEKINSIEPKVLAHLHRRQDHGNGYQWLYLDGFTFGGASAYLSLCFAHERLESLGWSVSLPGAPIGWPDQAGIDAEVRFVRAVLAGTVGYPPRKNRMSFSWGELWSVDDPKAGFASHGLRYRQ